MAGEVEAAELFGLYGNLARKNPESRLLYDTVLEWRDLTGTWPIHHVLAAYRDTVDERPELPTQVVAAFNASRDYAKQNFTSLMDRYAKQSGVSRQELEARGHPDEIGGSYSWSVNVEERKTIQEVIDMSREFGLISKRYEADELIFLGPSVL